MPMISRWALIAVSALVGRGAFAQTQYYNLDGGRPGRVEDAEATARYALGVDLRPFQYERLVGGTSRYRAEPKISYGVLPFTEIEARVPIMRVDPPRTTGGHSVTGVASLAVGALHAFNLETPAIPAIAIAGEVTLTVGTLAGPGAAYLVKMLTTRTTPFGRVHVNVGAGTYSVRSSSSGSDTACVGGLRFTLPGQTECTGRPPIIFDSPCDVTGSRDGSMPTANAMCMPASTLGARAVAAPAVRTEGARWLAGAGIDHSFALRSTLLTGDIVAEHFVGLYSTVDWTAETGIRHQVTPKLVVDAGIGWHFAGVVRSASVTLGASYELATSPLFGRSGRGGSP